MTLHHGLDTFALYIGSRKAARVQQHFTNVVGEGVPVPDPEMEHFMPPEEHSFETQRRENMVHAGEPLGHSHVVGVLRFEQKLEQAVVGCGNKPSVFSCEAAIGWDLQ